MRKLKFLSVFFICILCFEPVHSQQTQNKESFSPSIGLSTSYAPVSFRSWGTMENTQLTLLKGQFVHTNIHLGALQFHVSTEFIFTGWVYFPIDGLNGPKENRFGIGFTPLRLDIPIGKRDNYPFLTSSAGLLFTDRPFPNEDGTRLNFLLDAGVGYTVQLKDHRALQFGYKLHHLSNGNTGRLNPGIDSHMFFLNFLIDL